MKYLLFGRRGVILRMSLVIILVLFGVMDIAGAENINSHTVIVEVLAINELAINSGDITLTIESAAAGKEPDEVTDNTCKLKWTTNTTGKKITVKTDLASPTFTLKVEAKNVKGGTAASEVTLSTTGQLFVTGIEKTTGSCKLKYTASATAAQGTGTDKHIITYTLADVA